LRAVVVDTSVLHAYLWSMDRLHEAAVALLRGLERIVAPSIVVHEVVWSSRRRWGPEAARDAAERLLGGLEVVYEPVTVEDVEFALRDTRRYHDLLVVSVALRLRLPLATLDRGMARLARRHGVELLAPPRHLQR
jgi:predicted nucleic acid-binding protein